MTGTPVKDFGKVAVLMGGWSAEREISLLSGEAVIHGLRAAGVDARAVDVGRDIADVLLAGDYDRAFNILHGAGGEDGVIQGLLDALGLPYTGSGVKASAVSMDKIMTKRVWRSAGLPTPDFMRLTESSNWRGVVTALGLPLIVKPASEGSSIGMTRVEAEGQLADAWARAAGGGDVFAEQWIEGREFTTAILGNGALPSIRLETPREFYDFEAKYKADDTLYHCPCGLDEATEAGLGRLCLQAFHLLDARGWGRVDFMLDHQGKPWLIELNTVPGMTSHSLVPKAAAVAGMGFEDLVCRILATSNNAGVKHGEKTA